MRLDLRREDESRTTALLRQGAVMAAVTTEATAVPGCTSTRLGRMRYRPMAAPGFARRWFPDGPTAAALSRAPVVVFDHSDQLQHRYARRRARRDLTPPAHHIPSSADFLAAVRLGLGWGMLPDLQTDAVGDSSDLVPFDPTSHLDVVLHWQQWKLRSPVLERVTEAVLDGARHVLH